MKPCALCKYLFQMTKIVFLVECDMKLEAIEYLNYKTIICNVYKEYMFTLIITTMTAS